MNAKKFLPLVIAVILGGLAAKMAMDVISQNKQVAQAPTTPKSQVVVAKHPIDAGEMITESDVDLADVDSTTLPDTVFHSTAELIGRVPVISLIQGYPITATVLAPKGTVAGLQAIVPQGLRAVTVEINEFSGLAGYLVPGAHVDVIQTMRNDRTGDILTKTIVQDAKVTVVGTHHGDGPAESAHSVTLLVTPRDAEVLELASSNGRPRLVLRGNNDRSLSGALLVSFTELRGNELTMADVKKLVSEAVSKATTMASATTQPSAAPAGIQNNIPLGMRLITIRIDEANGLAGYLLPGDHVDVIEPLKEEEKKQQSASSLSVFMYSSPTSSGSQPSDDAKTDAKLGHMMVVRNSTVIAVGNKHGDGQPENAQSITLLMGSRDCEALTLAIRTCGDPRLVLRSNADSVSSQTQLVFLPDDEMAKADSQKWTVHVGQGDRPEDWSFSTGSNSSDNKTPATTDDQNGKTPATSSNPLGTGTPVTGVGPVNK